MRLRYTGSLQINPIFSRQSASCIAAIHGFCLIARSGSANRRKMKGYIMPADYLALTSRTHTERRLFRPADRSTLSLLLASSLLTMANIPFAVAQTSAPTVHSDAIQVADASAATAQDASPGGGLEEITVVGRHRAENKQDVPIPIAAISGKTLAEQHVDQLVDFKKVVPGFNLINSNPRVSAVVLRGVGGNASNDGSESGVGLIIDNVFYTHVGFAWLNLTDLDHIELLRGPQGTL